MVEVDKVDIVGVTWMKIPRTYQLGIRIKDGLFYKFTGFREQVLFTSLSFNVPLFHFSCYYLSHSFGKWQN